MPTIFIEETPTGTLQFEFSDKWKVYKYDEQTKDVFYDSIRRKGMKAVDFIAISSESVLLIEVKNIVANDKRCGMRLSATADNKSIENVTKQLQTNEELNNLDKGRVKVISQRPYLAEEVVKKTKDTLLGLLASHYKNNEKLLPYNQAIFVDKTPIFLILFLERTEDFNQEKQFKPLASSLQLAIKQKTDFLCAGVDVINSLTIPDILGINVSKIES